ncbi:hypothetical protein Aperf_G00000112931 [Anoplocephala perfoliata]
MGPTMPHYVKALSTMGWKEIANLAEQFVLQYYEVMRKCPSELYRFYLNESTVIFESQPACGQDAIHNLFSKWNLKEACVHILHYAVTKPHGNFLVMQINGEMNFSDGPYRRFSRSITLFEKRPGDYFIMNDIMRFQDRVYVARTGQHTCAANQGGKLAEQRQTSKILPDVTPESRNKIFEGGSAKGTETETSVPLVPSNSALDPALQNSPQKSDQAAAQQQGQTSCNQQTEKSSEPTVMLTWAQRAAKNASAPTGIAPKLRKETKPVIVESEVTTLDTDLRKQLDKAYEKFCETKKQGTQDQRSEHRNNKARTKNN